MKVGNLWRNTFMKALLVIWGFVGILGVYFFFTTANTQKTASEPTNRIITKEEIANYLSLFSSERFSFSEKEKVRKEIKNLFQGFGYQVSEQKIGNYINIIAERKDSGDYTLVAAHYDTVKGTPGADDNGSALSVMMAVAKNYNGNNVKFVAFDGEEDNFVGSKYFAESEKLPKLMISLEMNGYYSDKENSQKVPDFFNIYYRGLYNRLKKDNFKGDFISLICDEKSLESCSRYERLSSNINLKVYSIKLPSISFVKARFLDLFRSDHTPFVEKNIPSIMITDSSNFRNPNYHKTTDTKETLDLNFMEKQANVLINFLGIK
ncbi:MAG: M28 family peptidase [Patescibacteria group bacterium]|nr:M28 family peptidase [Patescibacteria group bacterium]